MNEEMQCIRCILDAGELILKSGGEISRVEDTMTRMFHAYGFLRADVFTITSSIVVTVYTKNGEILTQTRRVSGYDMNLERVHEMNQLARDVCTSPMPLTNWTSSLTRSGLHRNFPVGVWYCCTEQ